MTAKKSYNRFFIIFQEEDKGFGIAIDKQPTGYAKVEVRNGRSKITVYVQNVKKEKGPYHFCMIDTTKTPALLVKLGEVKIDETGRGETWWEFNEDNIAETKAPADKFNVALLMVEGSKVVAPLVGYSVKEKIMWKDKISIHEEHEHKHEHEHEEHDHEHESHEHEHENENHEHEHENEEHEHKHESHEHEHENEEHKHEHENEENVHEHEHECENHEHENKENENMRDMAEENVEIDPEAQKFKEYEERIRLENEMDAENVTRGGIEEERDILMPDAEEVEYDAGCINIEMLRHDHHKKNENCENKHHENENKKLENINENKHHENKHYENKPCENMELHEHHEEHHGHHEEPEHGERIKHSDMFHHVLKNFEEVKDISEEFERCGCRWWKIPHDYDIPVKDNKYYPYFCAVGHLKITYPYINYIKYFKAPGHYYFGMKYDDRGEVKYIMYGIEGRNTHHDQPYMGMTGFSKWVTLRNRDTGMWLMFYNPHTGSIMIHREKEEE